jgi:prepilin-type N-terminal cleavage/methylation domain-containing protein
VRSGFTRKKLGLATQPTGLPVRSGFTLLEVMIALAILSVSLLAVYQAQSNSLLTLSDSDSLWKATSAIQRELLFWERSKEPPSVSLSQGTFPESEELSGWRWLRTVEDTEPLPGVEVRKVNYRLEWNQGPYSRSFDADLYVRPN